MLKKQLLVITILLIHLRKIKGENLLVYKKDKLCSGPLN